MTKNQKVRRKLLRWYAASARELPWRRTRDPYAIWVSEIMLQQTRVDTVIPYYERFMKRFPTVDELANAKEEDVLSLWSGLGYYRRARLLHRGARQVYDEHTARVPQEPKARRAIAGVGAYTAGAIGSIAYGLEEPIVDGNVKRVLSRIFEIEEPVNAQRGEKQVWALATALVRGSDPGTFNQAMMELGALVCTPRSPHCPTCPIQAECTALKHGKTEALPNLKPKKKPRKEPWLVVAPLLLGKREIALELRSGERFGGLWTLPMELREQTSSPKELLREKGIRATVRGPAFMLRHQLTHRDMELEVHLAVAAKLAQNANTARFVSLDEKPKLPAASLTHKLLAGVRDVVG